MISLAKLSMRRPKAALAVALMVTVALGLIGLGVDHSLSPSVTVVPATDSYRAQHLAEQKFGPSQLVPILLEGPKAQLDREGPKLVVALTKRPNTRVLSAWDAGTASAGLRPKPTAAMVVVSVNRAEKDAVKYDQPQIQRLVSRTITPPAKAYISGQPSIDQAWQHESISTLKTASAIAIGVLFLMLMIGLRAPMAAVLVTGVAIATTVSALGLMALLGKFMTIDAIALATGAIAGLARGASYSLVMLDRVHRDEQGEPARPVDSVITGAVDTTGRALLYAGTVMLAAMLVADMLGPTDVLATLGIGAFLCTLLATGAAVVVVPAVLELTGSRVNWRVPAPAFLSRVWDGMVGMGASITRHALPVGALATALLLVLAVPALGVKSGPMDVGQLPPDNQARVAFNEISRVMGPGYATPYDIVVSNPRGPITTAAALASLNQFEKQIAQEHAVYSVTGPGVTFNPSAVQLKKFGPSLANSAKISNKSKKDLVQLINGLGQAGAGSAQLQAGLAAASSGAGQLQSGGGQAGSGAGQLHTGLVQARAGSAQLAAGLNQALSGANALKSGAGQALTGASQLAAGLGKGAPQVTAGLPSIGAMATASVAANNEIKQVQGEAQSARGDISSALSALDGSGAKSDPGVQQALAALGRANGTVGSINSGLATAGQNAAATALIAGAVKSQINLLAPQLTAAANGASQLAAGISQLHAGNAQLASGLDQLSGGGGQLLNGLDQLTAGAGALQIGLGQLTNGAGQLASGLSGGVGPAGQLTTGLGTMQAAVIKSRGQIPSTKDLETLQRQSPGIFNSGYFVLAAVEGAQPADRNAAQFMVNLLRGGNAAQIIVASRYPLSDARSKLLGARLRAMSSKLAKSTGLSVAVGGPAGSLYDVAKIGDDKIPAVLIGMVLVVTLLLALMLRSILIPAIGVLSAALTTAAGAGIIELLFTGSNPPLGGPGTFDPVTKIEVLVAMFGATLLYIVVLLARTRDYFVVTGDARGSLVHAMRSTVAATSGIAAITIGVVIPFAFSEMVGIRRIAVAAAVSVFLVAYVIIPVWLPAAVSLAGRRGWWPTHGPRPAEPEPETTEKARRIPWLHIPHRRPGPAH